MAQLSSWNRQIDPACYNFQQSLGWVLCVSDPSGYQPPVLTSTPSQQTTYSNDAPIPTKTGTGSQKHCGKWYTVASGDDCGTSGFR
jgi:hypothetical protein